MIVHQPEIIKKEGYALLWAALELDKKRDNFPTHLWYRVPDRYAAFLRPRSDAFLVSALLAGMHFDETIKVRGAVSPRLAYHLDEYQTLLSFRKPNIVRKVDIQYDCIAAVDANPSAVGSTFSGGVDSLFSVYQHLPMRQANPDYQLTHGLFIRGFDILPRKRERYALFFARFQQEAKDIGIELLELETNMMGVAHKRLTLSYMFGPLLVSTALAFSGLFKRFYIPSSWDYYTLLKTAHSSDPFLDGLLSTDKMEIIHHGAAYRRIEKLESIADWDVAQRSLWVCIDSKPEKEKWNCSRCEKCIRTMIPLFALDKLHLFHTFQKHFENNKDILWWARKFSLRHNFFTEMFPFLKSKKPELLPWFYLTILLGYVRYAVIKFMPSFFRTWLRRYGYFVTHNDATDAYEVPEITQMINDERQNIVREKEIRYHDH